MKSRLKLQEDKIISLEKLNIWYIEQLKLRQKEKFGISSEKALDGQITLFDLFNEVEELQEGILVEPDEEVVIPTHKRKKTKRGSKLDSLPVETIEYRLSDEEKVCDICGTTLTEMKKEVRKELKIIPAKVSVVEHVTYVYSCRSCDKEGTSGFIKKANSPKALIPKV